MNDDDLERLLRGYRPAAPRAALRERVMDAGPAPGRTWPWAAAAAALLAATIGLHHAAGALHPPTAPAAESARLAASDSGALRAAYGSDLDSLLEHVAREAALEARDLPPAAPPVFP